MVRSFTNEAVAPDALERIINAGHSGPSAGNTRSLELVVLEGIETDSYWDTTLSPGKRDAFPWPGLLNAPVLLIPYVDPSAYVNRYAEADKARTGLGGSQDAWTVPYWWVDGGAAVENMLLASIAEGLGACFFGQFEHETAVSERFGVPEGRRAVGTIAVGHPDPSADRPSTSAARPSRPTSQVTHRGSWQDL